MRDIAVVGMACRFPGGIDGPDSLWSALMERKVTAGPVPLDRWDVRRYYAKDEQAKGKAYVERGNFLTQDIRTMDAEFFDLPPRVAENLDPQQRLLLEVTWEAFENAGLDLPGHAGRKVGVYVGGFMLDHMVTSMMPANRSRNNANTAAGMMMTMLSNRLSHAFDLRGPSLSIDTACSSSLVAFVYACQDLWAGRCEMALVGGSNVMTRPEYPIGMSKGQFLSRDGQCKSFDVRGDGYGRSEGAGVVLLKPLEAALADGDPVLAVVKAAGVNSDGRTPGISMPSAAAQRRLIEEVCTGYSVDPSTVHCVECHGTGTAVGDPIEASSVGGVYGNGRTGDDRVVLGSIKSNVGHMEAAAGVAGVIKAVLTAKNRLAPPLGNFQSPHPGIPFEELGVRLPVEATPLGRGDEDIRVAVNSFGYGGTNAHVVLSSYHDTRPAQPARDASTETRPSGERPWMLPLSARGQAALKARAAALQSSLADAGTPLHDILYTASRRRAHLNHRAMVLGADRAELIAALGAVVQGVKSPQAATGVQPFQGDRKPVWVLTGMGPQWWGMGQQLYLESPVYRQTVDAADEIYKAIAGHSILEEMLKPEEESRITRTELAQPGNFMVQIGIAAILREAGVVPGAIVGHSVGEVSAAYLAGVLSLEDALRVSHFRAALQATTAGTGSMLAVGVSAASLADELSAAAGKVEIAAVNGPSTITLSGDTAEIDRLAERLTAQGAFNRKLTVEVPYHSFLMQPIMAELTSRLQGIEVRPAQVPLYSSVSGALATAEDFGASYWQHNVREPVRFMDAVLALIDAGYVCFAEVGPHPVLASALRDTAKLRSKEIRLVETLRRNEPEVERVNLAAASVYAQGCELDWSVAAPAGAQVPLPAYPWQRETLWQESERSVLERVGLGELPLLGIQNIPASSIWQTDLEGEPLAYLHDHIVMGRALMPAAGYVETLLELAATVEPEAAGWLLRDAQIHGPLLLSRDRAVDFVTAYQAGNGHATIRSTESGHIGQGQLHMTATVGTVKTGHPAAQDIDALRARFQGGGAEVTPQAFYESLARIGLAYGPRFRTLREVWLAEGRDEVLARVALEPDEAAQAGHYRAHPAALDACFQTLVGMVGASDTAYLPTGFGELHLLTPSLPSTFWCHARLVGRTAKHVDCDLTLIDEAGRTVATIQRLRVTASSAKVARTDKWGDTVKLQILRYTWKDSDDRAEPKRLGHWMMVEPGADENLDGVALGIEAFGGTVIARMPPARDAAEAAEQLAKAGRLDGFVWFADPAAGSATDPVGSDTLASLASYCRAFAALPDNERPRAYVVTRGAFATAPGEFVEPAHAAVNGFVRVAFNELEGLCPSTVDLPRQPTQDDWDGLVLELVCDAAEDEVALRGARRQCSSLHALNESLTAPRVSVLPAAEHAYRVRGVAESDPTPATVLLSEFAPAPLGRDDIAIEVEALTLPVSALASGAENGLDEAYVEVVGKVTARGDAVRDLAPGTRVYGLAPAEVASQLRGPRRGFHLVEIGAELPARELLIAGIEAAVADHLAAQADLGIDSVALCAVDSQSITVARALTAKGATVAYLGTPPAGAPAGNAYADTHQGLDQAVRAEAPAGFDVLVAPMAHWSATWGWGCAANGAVLIDTQARAQPLALPPHVHGLLRADLSVLTHRSHAFAAALRRAVVAAGQPGWQRADLFSAAVADLTRERLTLPSTDLRIALRFDAAAMLPMARGERVAFPADATYLVTGGLGGFGQKTADWLVQHGARHLVLTGRSGADTPERQAFVQRLQAHGAEVVCAAVDVANVSAMGDLLGSMAAKMPPLKGVFHAAAIIVDEPVADLDPKTLRAVMRNKAEGARVLHELTRKLPLDHFVLYSSAANLIGNSRQASYSSANGYLDGLAWRRRAEGLPGLSMNFGAISDVGVVVRDERLEQFLRYVSLRGIESAEALDLMGRAMLRDVPQVGVTLIHSWAAWGRYEAIGSGSPRYAALVGSDTQNESGVKDQIRAELAALPASERVKTLAGLVVALVANELESDPASMPQDRPIPDLGVDSLMATEIQLALDRDLGINVAVLDLLGDTTIRGLVDKALAQFGLADASA